MTKEFNYLIPSTDTLIFKLIMVVTLLSLIGKSVTVNAIEPFEAEGKYMVQGAPIHGANGIYFDSDNMLHIASISGREIVVMNPETGEIIERLGVEKGVEGPDDLIIGLDGSVYWTRARSKCGSNPTTSVKQQRVQPEPNSGGKNHH